MGNRHFVDFAVDRFTLPSLVHVGHVHSFPLLLAATLDLLSVCVKQLQSTSCLKDPAT